MNIIIISVATFFMLCAALMSFMMVIFWGGAIANAHAAKWMVTSANILIYALPTICVLSSILVWIGYAVSNKSIHYWWFSLPAPLFIYLAILMILSFSKN